MPPYAPAILGGRDEPEVKKLVRALEQRGVEPLLIDTRAFPTRGRIRMEAGQWHYDDTNLSAVRVAFIRRLFVHPLEAHLADELDADPRAAVAASREKESLLRSVLAWMRAGGATVINPIETLACHFLKPETIRRLSEADLPLPDTLVTNDPEAVRRFAACHHEVIYKPLSGGACAQRLTSDDLSAKRLAQLQRAPVLFQERVAGADVRAYVLAGRVVAAGMLDVAEVDFRRAGRPFAGVALSAAERDAAVQAARITGLTFAGIDLKRTPDGRCVLLDVNPAPMFAVFDDTTRSDVTGAVADLLVNARMQPVAS